MWDNEFGGFYQLVDSLGNIPEEPYSFEKRAYGNSFAIYALAAYYEISNDTESWRTGKRHGASDNTLFA